HLRRGVVAGYVIVRVDRDDGIMNETRTLDERGIVLRTCRSDDRQTGHETESAADERAHGAPLCRMGYDVHGKRNLGATAGARQSLDRNLRTGATMRVRLGIAALLFSLLPFDGVAQAVIETDGATELGVALRRLGTTKRVLMVAAHPDDENTALIAELALGQGADVAYLSLTRGEGG